MSDTPNVAVHGSADAIDGQMRGRPAVVDEQARGRPEV
jgi:hypothetical protein